MSNCAPVVPVIPPAVTECPVVTGTCPVPDAAATTNYSVVATATVTPPAPVDEGCGGAGGKTTDGGTGGSSVQVVYVPVAGPPGPPGEQGECGKGFDWRGEWEESQIYYTWEEGYECNASIVMHNGSTYVCIETHGADSSNMPGQFWSDNWRQYWADFAQEGKIGLPGITDKIRSLLNGNFKDILDWSNWSVGDWVKRIAGVAAIGWVGKKVIDMMNVDPIEVKADGDADFRYNGSPSYAADAIPPNLPDTVSRLCLRAGLTSDQFDVSQLPTDQLVYGTALTGSTADVLTTLKYIYGFDVIKSTQSLIFVPYNLPPVMHIPLDDMGFDSRKRDLSRYSLTRLQSNDLPKKVELTFRSPELNYHNDMEKSVLFSYKQGQDVGVTLPFVLTNQQAKDIAERALVQAHAQANSFEFTLPYKYMNIQPGDNVTTDLGALRIISIDENPNNVLNVTAVGANDIDYALQSSGQPVQTARTSTNSVNVPVFTAGILLDLPPLDSSDNQPRLFAAVHGYNDEDWTGAQVYETKDNGASYEVVATSSGAQSTVGIVDVKVAAIPENKYFTWDNTTSIIARVKTGELLSAPSNLSVYNGQNVCMIGNEMLAFRDAELLGVDELGNKRYKLTKLLRGLRGTEWAIPNHEDEELFVLIDDTLLRLDFPLNERERQRTYRFVTNGSDPSVAEDQVQTPYMVNLIPWRVSNLKGGRIGSSYDYGFEWNERPSFDNELQSFRQSTRDMAEWGGWAVVLLDPNDLEGEPLYTEFVYETNYTLTEAKQIEVYGSVQSCINLRVITMSRKVGGGYARDICVS